MSASVDQKFETFVEETLEEKAPTDGAGKADPMQKLDTPAPQDTSKEDLGGPTNQNYKNDHSAKTQQGYIPSSRLIQEALILVILLQRK